MDIDYTRRNKKPRQLSDAERDKLDEFIDAIHYSSRYVRLRLFDWALLTNSFYLSKIWETTDGDIKKK